MVELIHSVLLFSVPLMIVALAGVFAERSGVINIALEGIMIFGAFIGVLITRSLLMTPLFGIENGQLLLIIVIILSALGGAIFSLLLSFASIKLKADQTIGGTALNLLAPAIVLFITYLLTNQSTMNITSEQSSANSAELFMLKETMFGYQKGQQLPFLFDLFINKMYPSTYYAFLIFIVLSVILYKTKFGLRLRSCGENPQASASLGIDVIKMRYIGVTISGALAGFGGFLYALTSSACASTGDVAGMGFLALAVMIFGNWKPLSIFFASILFGALKSISVIYLSLDLNGDGIAWLNTIGISGHVYRMLPYIITLIVLAFTSKKSRAPKAEGIPYDKTTR